MSDEPTDPEDETELDPTELSETHTAPGSTTSAEQIGPYRFLEKLGEGGMGQVWLAEQQQPVKRKVALKVIKQGMDTKQVVARFEAEPSRSTWKPSRSRKRVLGEEHLGTLITVHNLACVYRDTGRFDEARKGFERVQRFCDAKLRPEHAFALANLDEHAKLLRKRDDEAGADRMETRARAIREKQSGTFPKHLF